MLCLGVSSRSRATSPHESLLSLVYHGRTLLTSQGMTRISAFCLYCFHLICSIFPYNFSKCLLSTTMKVWVHWMLVTHTSEQNRPEPRDYPSRSIYSSAQRLQRNKGEFLKVPPPPSTPLAGAVRGQGGWRCCSSSLPPAQWGRPQPALPLRAALTRPGTEQLSQEAQWERILSS